MPLTNKSLRTIQANAYCPLKTMKNILYILAIIILHFCLFWHPLVTNVYAQTAPTWKPYPTPEGGIFRSFAANKGYLFASSCSGSVFRSPDNGASWFYANKGLEGGYIQSLAVSDSVIIAATRNGIFISNNASEWRQSTFPERIILAVLAHRKSIYAIVSNTTLQTYFECYGSGISYKTSASKDSIGLFRSDDNGQSWQQVQSAPQYDSIYAIHSTDSLLFAVNSSGQLSRSDNNGRTWVNARRGLENTLVRCITQGQNNILYAGTYDGIFTSRDNGLSWSSLQTNLPQLMVSSLQASRYFYAHLEQYTGQPGTSVYWSKDGQIWKRLDSIPTVNKIEQNNGSIILLTEQGVFRLTDSTKVQPINNGLYARNVGSLLQSGSKTLVGTANPNGGLFYRDSINWVNTLQSLPAQEQYENQMLRGYREGFLAVNLGINICVADRDIGTVYCSKNNGETWQQKHAADIFDKSLSLTTLDKQMYYGTETNKELFVSNDSGQTWDMLKQYIRVFQLAKRDSTLFAASASDGLLAIQNGFVRNIFPSIETFVDFYTRRSLAVACDRTRIIVGTESGIYFSTDNGQTWSFSGLQDYAVSSIVIAGRTVFVGSNKGVFRSDNMQSWLSLNNGLSNIRINRLAIIGKTLYALTRNGAFEYNADITTSVSDNVHSPVILASSFPNPTTDLAELAFTLPRTALVSVALYSALGTEVWRSESATMSAGEQHIRIDTRQLPTGVYAYRLMVDGVSSVGRIVVVR